MSSESLAYVKAKNAMEMMSFSHLFYKVIWNTFLGKLGFDLLNTFFKLSQGKVYFMVYSSNREIGAIFSYLPEPEITLTIQRPLLYILLVASPLAFTRDDGVSSFTMLWYKHILKEKDAIFLFYYNMKLISNFLLWLILKV